jgi:hypothetical protein
MVSAQHPPLVRGRVRHLNNGEHGQTDRTKPARRRPSLYRPPTSMLRRSSSSRSAFLSTHTSMFQWCPQVHRQQSCLPAAERAADAGARAIDLFLVSDIGFKFRIGNCGSQHSPTNRASNPTSA